MCAKIHIFRFANKQPCRLATYKIYKKCSWHFSPATSQRSLDCQDVAHRQTPGFDNFEGKCSDKGWSEFPSSIVECLSEYSCELYVSHCTDYVTGWTARGLKFRLPKEKYDSALDLSS
jgi:hypothetical protein